MSEYNTPDLLPEDEFAALISGANYRFAKTMPYMPHWYTMKNTWADPTLFFDVVFSMRHYGQIEHWGKRQTPNWYYYHDGIKYWTCSLDWRDCTLINKSKDTTAPTHEFKLRSR